MVLNAKPATDLTSNNSSKDTIKAAAGGVLPLKLNPKASVGIRNREESYDCRKVRNWQHAPSGTIKLPPFYDGSSNKPDL